MTLALCPALAGPALTCGPDSCIRMKLLPAPAVRGDIMELTSPTFRIHILPNALAVRPDLFEGLDSVLPALDVQLEESWSGLEGAPTEILITANMEQAICDSRAVFLVAPSPDPEALAGLLDTGRPVRWIPAGTDRGTWVDGFARFLLSLRLKERAQAETVRARRTVRRSSIETKASRRRAS